jgi:ribonuclease E
MMIKPHLRLRSLAVGAALVPLALVACGDDDADDATDTDDATDDASDTDTDDGENGDLAIEVASPSDGDEVGSSFEMTFDVSVPVGQDEPHHIHIHVDGAETPTMIYEDSTTLTDIEPGEHVIDAILVNQDHSPTDVSDAISVTAVEGGTDDDDSDDADDSDDSDDDRDDDGYDYG